ncbi:MAG: alpha-glucan family phosphorylase [Bacteroidales bacterium]|nr:alpha-glucan family phosphorylase [Bacteroidales bacterium]
MRKENEKPDLVFDISWEACNKVGGIHTVLATKAKTAVELYKDNYIVIGPDLRQTTWEANEFIEHPTLFKSWQLHAQQDGLSFRIGRWNVPGSPIIILVDFTMYFASRNKIFADFWEKYKLDSISGEWDYIEPVMFGYAAGRIIENFYLFNCYSRDSVVAHFHHWMSSSGILYLKEKMPDISTVLTIHGTTLANAYADRGNRLFTDMAGLDPGKVAAEYNVTAKHSLEYIAANQADVLTAVGDSTAKECELILGRIPDVITYNGFDKAVESVYKFDDHIEAKRNLLDIAKIFFNYDFADDTVLIGHSGRYQYHNKGIDMFVDILDKINSSEKLNKNILAFIMVPAHHTGTKQDVLARLNRNDLDSFIANEYLTHNLQYEASDAILRKIKNSGLKNEVNSKVKLIYVPCFLNGFDGIFNKPYYDLLPGFDLTIFPSYYEPWGYTPPESLAYGVPTITTTLTGFGKWLTNKNITSNNFLFIAERNDESFVDTVESIGNYILESLETLMNVRAELAGKSIQFSEIYSWQHLFVNYEMAFSAALRATDKRLPEKIVAKRMEAPMPFDKIVKHPPQWRKVLVKTFVPEKLINLLSLARNLWWVWNREGQELFESINKSLWEQCEHNPQAFLNNLSYDELIELEKNEAFLKRLESVYKMFQAYMSEKPHEQGLIAYFSMEFGLHDSIKIFSGGLGVLAGDYLKEASDSRKNIVGIGLLYRYGYFYQKITSGGNQISERIPQKFTDVPVLPVRDENNEWVMIDISLPGRTLYAKIWKVEIGRVNLYLLDTDIEENSPLDRTITHQLYGTGKEYRLKQEILLGIGGIKLLDAIGLKPELFHCNEGHAAFSTVERMRKYIQLDKHSFSEALEIVRATTLFTTHTPVPAGHDLFTEDLLRAYLAHYAEKLNMSWEDFINLGKMRIGDHEEEFSMSVLAVNTSQEVNGVSKIHGRVSREMFCKMWPDFFPEEIHIGHVTNGVHFPTWASNKWQELYEREFGRDYIHHQSDTSYWKKIHNVPDETIWSIRQNQRKVLFDFIKIRIMQNMTHRQESPRLIFETIDAINDNALTIGFARRFATYKRAHLLFKNKEKLSKLVNDPDKPLMFIFAGKAHPDDIMGQDLIKEIVEVSKMKEFLGKVLFIENYDMSLATKLVQGVDVWLNTPTRPLEASGTSGEKAVMNGVINFSVLDGWWAEGYKPNAGWALKEEKTYREQPIQDQLDAETIYNIISDEIIPVFYNRNEKDIPVNWISYVKNTISDIAPHFTMTRMIDDYYEKYYSKLYNRSKILFEDNFENLKILTAWKNRMIRAWGSIDVLSIEVPDSTTKPMKLGEKFKARVRIDLAELNPEDIGIEVIFGQKVMDKINKITYKNELELIHEDNKIAIYACDIFITRTGVFDYAFRMYAKNQLLPHRMDFNLIRWI